MLKHCSQSTVDVKRRSLRQTSTLERRLSSSLVLIEEEEAFPRCGTVGYCRKGGFGRKEQDRNATYNSEFSLNKPYSVSSIGLATLPRHLDNARGVDNCRSLQYASHASLSNSLTDVRQGASLTNIPRPSRAIKVYARCLRSDIEYKTVSVSAHTSSRQVILGLLNKFKMKHRDHKLFYLSMDVTIELSGTKVTRTIVLEDEARPVDLVTCNPWGDCKFSLQMKKGGLVRIYDSVLMKESKYKCLLISAETTTLDVVRILLSCYGLERMEKTDNFSLYEEGEHHKRLLKEDDKPLNVMDGWNVGNTNRFVLKRKRRSVMESESLIESRVIEIDSGIEDLSVASHDDSFGESSGSNIYFVPKEDSLSDTSGHDSSRDEILSESSRLSDSSRGDTFSESSRGDTFSDSSDFPMDQLDVGDRYHTCIQLDSRNLDIPPLPMAMDTSFTSNDSCSDTSSDRDSPRDPHKLVISRDNRGTKSRSSSQVTISPGSHLLPKASSMSSLSSSSDSHCCGSSCDPLHDSFFLI